MKKKISAIVLLMALIITGCSSKTTGSYSVIIEGKDFGPAVTKLVIDTGVSLDTQEIDPETFVITATKTFLSMNSDTKKNEEKTETGEVGVEKAYISDEKGVKTTTPSQYVTVELETYPTNILTKPFNYNLEIGHNENVGITYEINQTATLGKLSKLSLKAADLKSTYYPEADEYASSKIDYKDEEFGDITLTYASWKPETTEKAPLIVLLHGGGEGGTETHVAILGNKVVSLSSDEIQSYFENGAYILAPQTPTMWMDDGTGELTTTGKSMYTKALFNLIDTFVKENENIDTNRIYLGGGSNGGFMTVSMGIEYPNYFAALFPICEAYQSEWVTQEELATLVNTPIWFVHALNDELVNYETTTAALFERITEAGSNNVYSTTFDNVIDTLGEYKKEDGTPYEYNGHWSWIYVFNDEVSNQQYPSIYTWMSQQVLPNNN